MDYTSAYQASMGLDPGANQAAGINSGQLESQISNIANTQLSVGGGVNLTPVAILIGLVALLVVMRLLGDSARTDIQPAHIHIGGYNVLTITATSVVGIVLLKVLFNWIQVPGLTDVLNAV